MSSSAAMAYSCRAFLRKPSQPLKTSLGSKLASLPRSGATSSPMPIINTSWSFAISARATSYSASSAFCSMARLKAASSQSGFSESKITAIFMMASPPAGQVDIERAHALHVPLHRGQPDENDHAAQHPDGRQEQHRRAKTARPVGQVADQRRRERVTREMREQYDRAQHRGLHRGGHDVENDRGEWTIVPGIEEIRRQDQWREPAQVLHHQQRHTDRCAEHETGARNEDAAARPMLVKAVGHPAADERAEHPARQRPEPELPADLGDRQPVHALHERGGPCDQAIDRERHHRAAHEYPDQRGRAQYEHRGIQKVIEGARGDRAGFSGALHREWNETPDGPRDADADADPEQRRADLRRNTFE